jgi:GMP synthase-like glutamine amidotransferase
VKPILLVRNDPTESFGVALPSLAKAGTDVVTAHMPAGADLPPLDDVSAVITFGGTVNVDQTEPYPYLSAVRAYTREAVVRSIPYLGICLGSQLLARALDVEVVKGPKEVGFEPVRALPAAKEDALLSFLGEDEHVMQWHEDTHELPPGATLLVTGGRVPVQAYRVGDLAWGMQFHFEVDATELDWWLDIADAEIDIRAVWGKSAKQIRAEAARYVAAQEERGREIFRRFAGVAREPADARRTASLT